MDKPTGKIKSAAKQNFKHVNCRGQRRFSKRGSSSPKSTLLLFFRIATALFVRVLFYMHISNSVIENT